MDTRRAARDTTTPRLSTRALGGGAAVVVLGVAALVALSSPTPGRAAVIIGVTLVAVGMGAVLAHAILRPTPPAELGGHLGRTPRRAGRRVYGGTARLGAGYAGCGGGGDFSGGCGGGDGGGGC